jgi:hypothetical protein
LSSRPLALTELASVPRNDQAAALPGQAAAGSLSFGAVDVRTDQQAGDCSNSNIGGFFVAELPGYTIKESLWRTFGAEGAKLNVKPS